MKNQKIAALAASAMTLLGLALGTAPAGAQGYHHQFQGGGYSHNYGGGYHHQFQGGSARGFGGGYHAYGPAYRHGFGTAYYHGGGYSGRAFVGGPGYVHRSWAWYEGHSPRWRRAHPYHGSPSLGIFLRL